MVALTISNDIITLGNGHGDSVAAGSSNNDKIILGNGQNDSVSLGAGSGGDCIATGTGSGDMVDVLTHTHADIFAFALGTDGTNFTTVAGALVGDQVEVNNGRLGSTLVNEGENDASYTSLAAFISAIVAEPGHTYVGNNASDTFIYTDTSGRQTGAIEIAGTFVGSSISNYVLTLASPT